MRFGLLGLALLAPVGSARAQQPARDAPLTVANFLDLEQVSDPRISPDGKALVYTRGWVDKINDRWESAIWAMNADGSKNRFLVKGGSPVWSPDGTRIAYLAQAEEPRAPRSSCAGWTPRGRPHRSPG